MNWQLNTNEIKSISPSRNNNFNFLRLLFASLVIFSHGPEIADGNRNRELLTRIFHTVSFGEIAVNGFFILSGYLIVQSWQNGPDLVAFAKKRIRRIYPGFLVAFFVCALVIAPFAAPNYASYFAQLSYVRLLSGALQLKAPTIPAIFVGTHYPVINGAMWSISYEVKCYVIVALVGLCGARFQKGIWLTCLFITLALLPFNEQLRTMSFPGSGRLLDSPDAFFRLLTFFSAGACFYLFRANIPLKGNWAIGATVVLVVLLFQPQLASIGLAIAGTYTLFWVAFASIPALDVFKRIDDVSYGLYLYGWPIQKMLNWVFPATSIWLQIVVALLLAGLAGYISWHVIESPLLKKNSLHKVKA